MTPSSILTAGYSSITKLTEEMSVEVKNVITLRRLLKCLFLQHTSSTYVRQTSALSLYHFKVVDLLETNSLRVKLEGTGMRNY